jgi:hypothetical protein
MHRPLTGLYRNSVPGHLPLPVPAPARLPAEVARPAAAQRSALAFLQAAWLLSLGAPLPAVVPCPQTTFTRRLPLLTPAAFPFTASQSYMQATVPLVAISRIPYQKLQSLRFQPSIHQATTFSRTFSGKFWPPRTPWVKRS